MLGGQLSDSLSWLDKFVLPSRISSRGEGREETGIDRLDKTVMLLLKVGRSNCRTWILPITLVIERLEIDLSLPFEFLTSKFIIKSQKEKEEKVDQNLRIRKRSFVIPLLRRYKLYRNSYSNEIRLQFGENLINLSVL